MEGWLGRVLHQKSVVYLEFEVWYPSLNPLPFKESFPKDFKKRFQTQISSNDLTMFIIVWIYYFHVKKSNELMYMNILNF